MCSLYLPMKRHPVCITSTPTDYATSDTTIILHVYKPDFSSLRSYFLDRKLGPVCHQIGGRVGSSFLLGQWFTHLCDLPKMVKECVSDRYNHQSDSNFGPLIIHFRACIDNKRLWISPRYINSACGHHIFAVRVKPETMLRLRLLVKDPRLH